jgi:hypothetical protein
LTPPHEELTLHNLCALQVGQAWTQLFGPDCQFGDDQILLSPAINKSEYRIRPINSRIGNRNSRYKQRTVAIYSFIQITNTLLIPVCQELYETTLLPGNRIFSSSLPIQLSIFGKRKIGEIFVMIASTTQ